MILDEPNKLSGLLPERYPQSDLFICDVADAVLKDIMPQMEHPFYSLSKKPETNVRRYTHNDNWLEITPSVKGMATIYDKDILIYAISQLMAKLNRGEKVNRTIRINCHDLLIFANRGTAGKDYSALCEAIDRLAGTRISTNITTGTTERYDNFGLIDKGSISRKNGLNGRILWVELTISDWVFDAIVNNSVLTLNRDYFRLRKPIERRIYEICRKHCGQQTEWKISLELLHKKSGSRSSSREFKRIIKNMVRQYITKTGEGEFPDYVLSLDESAEHLTVRNREKWWKKIKVENSEGMPIIKRKSTLDEAKEFLGENDNIEQWYQDYVVYWTDNGMEFIKDPDEAFLGFCRGRRNKREGKPGKRSHLAAPRNALVESDNIFSVTD